MVCAADYEQTTERLREEIFPRNVNLLAEKE